MYSERIDPSAMENEAIRFAGDNERVKVVKLLLAENLIDASAVLKYVMRLASERVCRRCEVAAGSQLYLLVGERQRTSVLCMQEWPHCTHQIAIKGPARSQQWRHFREGLS